MEETLKVIETPHIVLNVQTETKYANCKTAIYDKPILDDTYIHDYSLVNTSFEIYPKIVMMHQVQLFFFDDCV